MGIILWIIFGGIVGWVGSVIVGTNEQQGMILNVVVGIVGAALGGLMASFFGVGGINGFSLYSFLVALAGAVLMLSLVKFIKTH